jgi:Transposase
MTVTVLPGPERRRRWTTAEKLRIVEESETGEMPIVEVARRHGIHPNQLHGWRRRARRDLGAQECQLIPIAVAPARSNICRTCTCLHCPQLAVGTFRALSCPAMALRLLWPAARMSLTIGSTLAANYAVCALRATRMRSTAPIGSGVPSRFPRALAAGRVISRRSMFWRPLVRRVSALPLLVAFAAPHQAAAGVPFRSDRRGRIVCAIPLRLPSRRMAP